RLEGEIKKVELEIVKVHNKLASTTFVQNAPVDVVEEHRAREAGWIARRKTLEAAVLGLKG
ncbi:MAG: hypothetical protein WEB60_09330, partial [Terrimicrobiaceae bacterium]